VLHAQTRREYAAARSESGGLPSTLRSRLAAELPAKHTPGLATRLLQSRVAQSERDATVAEWIPSTPGYTSNCFAAVK
jgi:hypothetical protein